MSSLLFVEKILHELEIIHKGGEGKKYGGILVWLDCTLTLFIFRYKLMICEFLLDTFNCQSMKKKN